MTSVSTVVFDGYPLETGLDILSDLGIRAVEPAYIRGYVDFTEADFSSASAGRLQHETATRGLRIQALSAHMDLSAEDAPSALARRIDFAAETGASFLITNAGPAAARARIERTVSLLAERLEAASLRLALENPGHGQGDLLGTIEQSAAFIAELDIPNVGLNIDIGNFATYSANTAELDRLDAILGYAVHAHLKDYCEDGDGWRFVPLGVGKIDWHRIGPEISHLPSGIELPLRLSRPGRTDPIRSKDPVALEEIRGAISSSLRQVEETMT